MFEFAPTSRQRDSIRHGKWLTNPIGDPKSDLSWEELFRFLLVHDPDNFKDDAHDPYVVAYCHMDIIGAPPVINRWEAFGTIDSNLAVAGTVFSGFPFAGEGLDTEIASFVNDVYVFAVDQTPVNITGGQIQFELFDPAYAGVPTWVPITASFALSSLNKPLDCVHGALNATAAARVFCAKARDFGVAIKIAQKFAPANASANYCFGVVFERVAYPFAIPY